MQKYKDISALIVDDVANMRSFLMSSLRSIDMLNLRDASSAIEGMRMYQQKRPDIVFLDLDMPEVSGLTMLRTLKQKDPDAFIVIVSGESKKENVKEALKLGAKGFIVKPYNLTKITAVLDKVLALKKKS